MERRTSIGLTFPVYYWIRREGGREREIQGERGTCQRERARAREREREREKQRGRERERQREKQRGREGGREGGTWEKQRGTSTGARSR